MSRTRWGATSPHDPKSHQDQLTKPTDPKTRRPVPRVQYCPVRKSRMHSFYLSSSRPEAQKQQPSSKSQSLDHGRARTHAHIPDTRILTLPLHPVVHPAPTTRIQTHAYYTRTKPRSDIKYHTIMQLSHPSTQLRSAPIAGGRSETRVGDR
ncbi:hypothetical protein M011DRAFT_468610 [Sporormia fimetaria CBS 119925]|uniref:Uncharacterized protein n=1 Tax=Sporormia fimetaria CBS 119925 TaxID=1340428 RepID=A0A6A6V7C3_9PLEO|nr:hypothetical protein M011DRAFT_468610 [Sporormia fimetaria CBS 119925]